jgi:hypothetical protein
LLSAPPATLGAFIWFLDKARMPRICEYMCRSCGFSLPPGWGGYLYVKNDKGEKIACTHPHEGKTVAEILGIEKDLVSNFPWVPLPDAAPMDLLRERVGFDSYCVCVTCLNKFSLDLEKEDRECPKCLSRDVKAELELIGQPCLRCKAGTIEEIETSLWV